MSRVTKEKQREYSKAHYEKNKEKLKTRAIRNTDVKKKRNQGFVDEYLEKHPCVDCGEKDIIVLEFDHVRGTKRMAICEMAMRSYSIKAIEDEIAKCEVRCANCHRRVTHNRRFLAAIKTQILN